MIYLYAGVLFMLLLSVMLCAGYKKELFRNLNKKEHPIRLFYPVSAKTVDVFRKRFSGGRNAKVVSLLRSIYVKENVEAEKYLYTVKKTATMFTIAAGGALLGLVLCLSRIRAENVSKLERSAPGSGAQTHELQVEYQGTEDVISLPIEEEKHSKEKILKLFDASIEEIKRRALGENESQEYVTRPLQFISQHEKISIFWEIENPDIVGYNGEIKTEPEDGKTQLLNLFITLSLDGVSKTYNFPVVISAPKLSEKERLVTQILEAIEENNDIYKKEVQLPESINGNKIVFRKAQENKDAVLFIFGVLALIVIAVGYDKGLENKVKKRKEQMLIDFTEIVAKLNLMYEAGSSIRKAWEKIVSDQEAKGEERYAYQEMKLALEKIGSGVRERDAYSQFGKRCGLHPYIKLGNILEQNLSKGTKGMKLLLKQETEDAFEERKRRARKKGEEASTKMLVPMILMMIVVIVIIAVPALMSINL